MPTFSNLILLFSFLLIVKRRDNVMLVSFILSATRELSSAMILLLCKLLKYGRHLWVFPACRYLPHQPGTQFINDNCTPLSRFTLISEVYRQKKNQEQMKTIT